LMVFLGIILTMIGLLLVFDGHSGDIGIGFILLVIGIAWAYFSVSVSNRGYLKNKEIWESTTGTTIKSLDNQIADKIAELKPFQDIVSSK